MRLSATVGSTSPMAGSRFGLLGDLGQLDAKALQTALVQTNGRFTLAGGVQTISIPGVPLPGRWRAEHGFRLADFAASNAVHLAGGFQVADISVASSNGVAIVSALWEKRSRPGFTYSFGISGSQLANAINNSAAAGRRPVHLEGYSNSGNLRYFGMFEKWVGTSFQVDSNTSLSAWPGHFHARTNAGYRPLRIDVVPSAGEPTVISLWDQRADPDFAVSFGIDESSLAVDVNLKAQSGFRPVRLSGHETAGQAKLNVIYERRSGRPISVVAGLDASGYQVDMNQRLFAGFRLVSVAVYTVGETMRYGAIWEQSERPATPSIMPKAGLARPELNDVENLVVELMEQHQISASALCIARNGTIVYERAFGWRDFLLREPMTLDTMVRVGSNSKPVTRAAIRKLESMGLLAMTDNVFDLGQVGGGRLGITPFGTVDSRLQMITIQHLFDHKGGWDRAISGDVLGEGLKISSDLGVGMHPDKLDVVRWVSGQVPLDHDPGTTYAYSNYGYMLLGMIIEAVTGQDATAWVKQHVLQPVGVAGADFDLGRTLLENRNAREPWYFEPSNAPSYNGYRPAEYALAPEGGWVTEFREVNGSWIFTPRAYAKYLMNYWVGSGQVRSNNSQRWSHGGSLPGSRSMVRQYSNGISYIYWFNQRHDADGNDILAAGFDANLRSALDAVSRWPADDPATQQAPEITAHPHGLAIAATSSADLSATAIGSGLLSYQWQFNGAELPGANAASLALANIATSHAGRYELVVANSFGSVTSAPAFLSVNRLLSPLTWTNPEPVAYGRRLDGGVLNASAGIPGAFTYVPTNGTLLTSGTQQMLSVSFNPGDASRYLPGTRSVFLDVEPAPLTVTVQHQSRLIGNPNPVFTFSVSGLVNGEDAIQLGLSPTITSAADAGSPLGDYPIVISGGAAANYRLIYVNGTLTITGRAPTLIAQPVGLTVIRGTPAHISVNAGGTPPLHFQWFFEAGALLGQTNSTLSYPGTIRAHRGRYRVAVSNQVGVVFSDFVNLRVLAKQRMEIPQVLPNGVFRLRFADDGGGAIDSDLTSNFVVEASSDFLTWSVVSSNGLGITIENGNFVFDDTVVPSPQGRFYRIYEK